MSLLDDLINIRNFASNGVVLPRRAVLNVVTGAVVADNPTTGQTDITYTAVHDLGGYPMEITSPEPFDMVSWDGSNFVNRPDRLVAQGEVPENTILGGGTYTHTSSIHVGSNPFMDYLQAGGVAAVIPIWPSSVPDGIVGFMSYHFTPGSGGPGYLQLVIRLINVTRDGVRVPADNYNALLLQTGPAVS